MLGELSLDGSIRNVTGALPIAEHAKEMGFTGCIFPKESALEAADVEGIDIYGVSTLNEVLDILRNDNCSHLLVVRDPRQPDRPDYSEDFKDVKGQRLAKRGLEIAAAGGHNLLLVGTPGSGKTFMASCLPSILPQMSRDESIETSKIYSITGNRTGKRGLMLERPFRSPHHSASLVSLIGGGQNASPGEVSLAHNGILYLDEMAQFSKVILDALRQPLEDGKVTISRARYKVEYPASFMLIASMNPCPCGYYGDDSHKCTCTQSAVIRYMSRISGPMLDRLDMHIFVKAVSGDDLIADGEEESSEAITKRVLAARQIQYERFRGEGIFTNSQMNVRQLNTYCKVSKEQKRFLRDVIHRLNLSARSYSRILKLSRTIADIDGDIFISLQHISEAIQFRNLDRGNFYD
jgi:magnesium chelatase family protein